MELSLLALLGTSVQTGEGQSVVGIPDANASGNKDKGIHNVFTAMMDTASARFRDEPDHHPIISGEAGEHNTPDEQLYLEKIADDLGEGIIAGVMPPLAHPIEDIRLQESFVAHIAFDPAVVTMRDGMSGVASASQVQDCASVDTSIDALLPIESDAAMSLEIAPTSQGQQNGLPVLPMTEHASVAPPAQLIPLNMHNAVASTPLRTIQHLSKASAQADDVETNKRFDSNVMLTDLDVSDASGDEATIGKTHAALQEGNALQKLRTVDPLTSLVKNTIDAASSVAPKSVDTAHSVPGGNDINGLSLSPSFPANNRLSPELLQEPSFLRLASSEQVRERLTPMQQVSVQMAHATQQGKNKISIQLFPEELGRVDVDMFIDAEKNAVARITTESKETYELLRADRHSLERILQEAGMKADGNSLEFNFRGDNGGASNGDHTAASAQNDEVEMDDSELLSPELLQETTVLSVVTGVNIKV